MSSSVDLDINEFMKFDDPSLFDDNVSVSDNLGLNINPHAVPQQVPGTDGQMDALPHYVGDAGVEPNAYPATHIAPTPDLVGWPDSRTVHSVCPADLEGLPPSMITHPWAPPPPETLDETHYSIALRAYCMLNEDIPPRQTTEGHTKETFNVYESETELDQASHNPVAHPDRSDAVLGGAQSEDVPPIDIEPPLSEGGALAPAAAYATDTCNEDHVSSTINATEVTTANGSHAQHTCQASHSDFNQDGFTSAGTPPTNNVAGPASQEDISFNYDYSATQHACQTSTCTP
ncbi:hypothetical protein SERLA73DRAFT_71561 [Serpula lacrymans var. lacrymans S7.3]|uniref:Uncharacterized protein n=1 Tax=Serpula lacrymans var. lacrymans (strain S7.3) TaxID=936435 RepID=F8PRC0_SERL3|nr:hypothetical protein SERLA73DRAFT_71561 [Serpula lacrymans var. lacrymans S7.3]